MTRAASGKPIQPKSMTAKRSGCAGTGEDAPRSSPDLAEWEIQTRIVVHYRRTYEGRICHVANGGKRGKREAKRLKDMGVDAGHPDLVIWSPIGPFVIEVKEVDGSLSANQEEYIADLLNMGYTVAVVYSVDEAIDVLAAWKLPLKQARVRSDAELQTGF